MDKKRARPDCNSIAVSLHIPRCASPPHSCQFPFPPALCTIPFPRRYTSTHRVCGPVLSFTLLVAPMPGSLPSPVLLLHDPCFTATRVRFSPAFGSSELANQQRPAGCALSLVLQDATFIEEMLQTLLKAGASCQREPITAASACFRP